MLIPNKYMQGHIQSRIPGFVGQSRPLKIANDNRNTDLE